MKLTYIVNNFEIYRSEFMKIWYQCMAAGYSTQDARQYAAMELDARIRNIQNSVNMKQLNT